MVPPTLTVPRVPGRRTIALAIESDGPGGAETMLLHLAGALRARGYGVLPLLPADRSGWLGAQFRARGFAPETFTLKGPLDPACVRHLAALLRRHDVALLHSHEFSLGVYGAAAAKRAGRPHVLTMHGGTRYTERWVRRAALRWAARASRAAVGVSGPTARLMESSLGLPAGSVHVIPNGVAFDAGAGAGVRAELGAGPDETLIVAVGNLYPVKGHRALLEALARLAATQSGGTGLPAWRLAIAGRGGEREPLLALAAEAGIADRVHLLGLRGDVPDLLAAADVFAMPSLSEGLPLALLEAMFAGKAIVASAVGGIPDVIAPGESGLLVPPGDVDALAAALRQLLLDPAARRAMGAAAARRATADYAVDRMADAYEALYRLD